MSTEPETPPARDVLEAMYATYAEEGHLVVIHVAFLSQGALTAWEAEGCPSTHLASQPADSYVGTCSCGACSGVCDGWEEARWWCRGHRASFGLDWQAWIPEARGLDRRLVSAGPVHRN
jgi:hypothetical protein